MFLSEVATRIPSFLTVTLLLADFPPGKGVIHCSIASLPFMLNRNRNFPPICWICTGPTASDIVPVNRPGLISRISQRRCLVGLPWSWTC